MCSFQPHLPSSHQDLDELESQDEDSESEEDAFDDDDNQSEALESEEEYESAPVQKYAASKQKKKKLASEVSSSTASTRNLGKLKKGRLIHFDSVNIPKGDMSVIDKFISTRTLADGTEEVLVKYKVRISLFHFHANLNVKNMSYLSSVWLPVKDMENDKNTRARIRRFLEKPSWETQWSDDEPYNPSYAKVY